MLENSIHLVICTVNIFKQKTDYKNNINKSSTNTKYYCIKACRHNHTDIHDGLNNSLINNNLT